MDSTVLKNQFLVSKWTAIMTECRESGIPVKDWLVQNNVSRDQYYYWKRRLKNLCLESIPTDFVELSCPVPAPQVPAKIASNETSPAASILFGTAMVNIYESATADFITKLFEAASHVK